MAIIKRTPKKERQITAAKLDTRALKFEILRESRVVKLPMGMAELIAEKITDRMAKWVRRRETVSKTEFDAMLVKVTKEYNSDLAFILKNRDRMI